MLYTVTAMNFLTSVSGGPQGLLELLQQQPHRASRMEPGNVGSLGAYTPPGGWVTGVPLGVEIGGVFVAKVWSKGSLRKSHGWRAWGEWLYTVHVGGVSELVHACSACTIQCSSYIPRQDFGRANQIH